ncbi:MAG TPA: hypothetical protein ENJ87_02090 [Gammaproteobacteria bacterium]|nr:hypothetical protein [Gammaproteobacteria bacterium]
MLHPKQFLLIILVFCTLGYSSAWAFDGHVMEPLEESTASLDTASGDLPDGQQHVEHICAHCCHITSHLIAIFSDTGCIATNSTSTYSSNLTESLHAFIVSPDLRPPRV